MEAALEFALANPGLGLLLLDEGNRRLAEDVEHLRQDVSRAYDTWRNETEAHTRNTERVTDMTQMLSNMQALVSAHQRDVEGEIQKERVAGSEAEGIVRQCRKRQAELEELQEASQLLESHAQQRRQELEELQKNVNGDTGLLQELLEELARAEDDNLLLLQYSAQDASKIKDLSVVLERTSADAATAESELSAAQGETAAAQAVLDQLGAAFLQAAAHRDLLLTQWEATLTHLYQTAAQHSNCIEDCVAVEEKLGILRHETEKEKEILSEVERSCQEVIQGRQVVEEEAQWVAGQLQATTTTTANIQAQVWGLENALVKVNKELEECEARVKQQRGLVAEKEAWQASLLQRTNTAHDNLNLNTDLLMSAHDTIHSLQTMLKETEATMRGLTKQMEHVSKSEQQHRQAVDQWHQQEATVKGEISALMATKARYLTCSRELISRQDKLRELLHRQEGEMEGLRRQLHHLTHDDNNNEADCDQRSRLELLQQRLQEATSATVTLTRQLTALKTVRGREQGCVRELEKTREQLQSDLTTIKMNTTSAERERVRLSNCREEVRVEVSLTQLHLQRQVQQLRVVVGRAAHLTQHKTNVSKMVGEQIESVKERVRATEGTVRGLEAELHCLTLQLHNITTTLLHLRNKYDKIKRSLDTQEDQDVSTTQVFLKLAHERAGLQEAGDLLDCEVRQAEQEVEALQQVVALVSVEAHQYRSTLHNIIHHSEEERTRVELEESLAALDEETLIWQAVLEEEQTALKGAEARQREVVVQVGAVEELLREKSVHLRAVDREAQTHRTKAAHARQATNTLMYRTRHLSHLQGDIELRLAAERLRTVHSLLGEAVSCYPEATQAALLYCQQAAIPPLTLPSLSRRDAFGSRSSLGTLQSSRSSSRSSGRTESRGSRRAGRSSVSPSGGDWWKVGTVDGGRHSSLSSTRSHDSGRSGSPQHRHPLSPSLSSSSPTPLAQTQPAKIKLMTPVFPAKEPRRNQYVGKKLHKRPNIHL
ncbi:hypothetical protein Pmani_009912 [Petrolisthes manimaculis]|uniref:Coiled-coil domain-containing protein 39 n=1 Tax=Petrolisthes manimaculis TaxID=1843537 RepID=A0AAE1Q410_9EUCA|nr:hypothetical protein Pmani_009912 [Petrolisthes manimaculis]